jgi:NADPH:quinone reductase-like Zn-dependent oxidoreductase
MRAFAIDEFGTAGSVHEISLPEPEDGLVRVRVAAAGVNPADTGVMQGFYKDRMEHRFPLIPGLDFAGRVDAIGAGVDGWQVGDEVFGGLGKRFWGGGTVAESTTASAGSIARRPRAIDEQFAAALPLAGVCALQSVDPLELRNGDAVLIIGAGGGIGGFAVQLAAAAGALVIAVTRGVNADYVRRFGAAETVDYSTQDVFETVKKSHPNGIAGIVATVGDKASLTRLAELVREGGHVTSMRGAADVEALAERSITGVNVIGQVTGDRLDRLSGLVASGVIKRPEIKTFPLDRAGDAYAQIADGHVRGKLVIIPVSGA